MTTRILDISALQHDFSKAADKQALIDRTNQFIADLKPDEYTFAILRLHTSFNDMNAANASPTICEYDTPGWKLAIDTNVLKKKCSAILYMLDDGGFRIAEQPGVRLSHAHQRAYNNLRRLTHDKSGIDIGIRLNCFVESLRGDLDVTLMGIKTCGSLKNEIKGYLDRETPVRNVHIDLDSSLIGNMDCASDAVDETCIDRIRKDSDIAAAIESRKLVIQHKDSLALSL